MRGTTSRRPVFSRCGLQVHLRTLVEALDRSAPTRGVARAVALAFVGATLKRLARQPGVVRVFARGSHGRGDFVPLASDLDLAIVLREPDRGPSFATALGVLEALARIRSWNPLLRDAWQLIVGDTEWPLVERHWSLVRLDDWRDADGLPPAFARTPVDERLILAARWNRLHLWTDSALRHVLAPAAWDAGAALAFAATEKKALWFATALAGEPPPRLRRPPPREVDEAYQRAAALLARLEDGARLVAARAGIAVPALPDADLPVADDERTIVTAVARCLPDGAGPVRVLLYSGRVGVAMSDPPATLQRGTALVAALARAACETGRLLFLYSPLSLALAPIYEPVRIFDVAAAGVAPEPQPIRLRPEPVRGVAAPLLLREQLLYEALFVGADLRSSAGRPADDPGLGYTTQRLARLLVYFETGTLQRDGEAAVATARGLHREVDQALARDPVASRDRFAANAALFVALVGALERDGPVGDHESGVPDAAE